MDRHGHRHGHRHGQRQRHKQLGHGCRGLSSSATGADKPPQDVLVHPLTLPHSFVPQAVLEHSRDLGAGSGMCRWDRDSGFPFLANPACCPVWLMRSEPWPYLFPLLCSQGLTFKAASDFLSRRDFSCAGALCAADREGGESSREFTCPGVVPHQ